MAKATNAAQSSGTGTSAAATEKKIQLYDLWQGKWEGRKYVNIPGKGNERLWLKWEFIRVKKLKTNINVTLERMEAFNVAFKIRLGMTSVEQLVPMDSEEKVFDILPNPFEAQDVDGDM